MQIWLCAEEGLTTAGIILEFCAEAQHTDTEPPAK